MNPKPILVGPPAPPHISVEWLEKECQRLKSRKSELEARRKYAINWSEDSAAYAELAQVERALEHAQMWLRDRKRNPNAPLRLTWAPAVRKARQQRQQKDGA